MGSPLQVILVVACVVVFVVAGGEPLVQVAAFVAMFGLVLVRRLTPS